MADAAITANTWNHFVVQYDPAGSGILHIGINGTLQAWAVGQPNRPSNNPTAAIGTIPGETGYTYTGHIDSLRISSGTTGGYSGPTYVVPTAPYSLAPPDPNAPQKTTLTLSLNNAIFYNPGNVYTIDGQYATGGTNNTSNGYNRYYTNATSVIPANAQILGTEYTIRGRVDTTAYGASCDVSWDGWANAGNTIAMPTTDTTIVRGGPTTVLGTPTLSSLGNLVMRFTQANSGGITNWWEASAERFVG